MKKKAFIHIHILVLFVGLFICGLLRNSAKAEGNLTLYVYQARLSYPKNAKEHLLVIASRAGKEPLPVLLYTSDGSNYAPVPVNDLRLKEGSAKARRLKQGVKPFVELVLGKKIEDLKGESVTTFQKNKLSFTEQEANGNWGDATWAGFAQKINDNTLGLKIVNLNNFAKMSFIHDLSLSLAKYDLEQMKKFASMVLEKFRYYKNYNKLLGEKTELTKLNENLNNQVSKLTTWRYILIAVIIALVGAFVVGIIVKILSSRKEYQEDEESPTPRRSGELQDLRQPRVERFEKPTGQIREMTNLLSAAKTVFDLMQKYKSEIGTLIENSRKESTAITEMLNSIEQEVSNKLYSVKGQISDRLEDLIKEKRDDIDELMAYLENYLYDADSLTKEIARKAETTTQSFEQIKELEENLRKENVAVWGRWVQDEKESLFTQAVGQLQEQYRQKLQEKIEGRVSPEKEQNLQRAQKLLEGFCGRMNQAKKQIPLSISSALERVNSLLHRLGQFSRFELSTDSLQDYNAQQAEQIIEAAESNTQLQQPNYESYIWQAYSRAFNVYAHQLKEEIDKHPTPLTDEEIERQFRDFASMTLNAFYPNTQADPEMQKIATYFDKKTLPSLLDAFGFEEIPITIGKTQVMESLHEITESRPSKYPSGTVIEVLSKGFRKKGEPSGVVRKARVIRAE